MAELDQTYYRGTDQYSDGDEAENAILDFVRAGKDLCDLQTDTVSWPVLYHLSPVRENICNWYPFRPGSRILEIGAGCGAVTGALCLSGAEVTSVDLSLRRSTINLERHRDAENLRVVVGNLNEVRFEESFDYVLLIGVLEYAGRFTEGKNPYRAFLENCSRFLKPEGRILIAIENRLGIKYFAGMEEDHLGKAFAGIRGYEPDEGVRTFSRSELCVLLDQAGFVARRFYYPWPDYKFPLEIFTDETLQSQHFGKPFQVFDKDQTVLFRPERIAEVLAEDGAAAALANSFLVEAGLTEDLPGERVLYAKLNNGRRKAFRIGTRIVRHKEDRVVEKYPLCWEAEDHLKRILENERLLSGRMDVICGEESGAEICYPFVRQRTLEDELTGAACREDPDGLRRILGMIRDLASVNVREEEYACPSFSEWFGQEVLDRLRTDCVSPANVDLMADNLFVENGQLRVADCEWVTTFPVPLSFLLWRMVERTWEQHADLEHILPKREAFSFLKIRENDIPVFRSWSWHFENIFVAPDSESRFGKNVVQTEIDLPRAERIISEQNQTIRNQEAHIQQLIESERNLQGKAKSQEAHIQQLIESERNLNGVIRQKEEELQSIYNSRSWKAMEIPRRIHRKLSGSQEEI